MTVYTRRLVHFVLLHRTRGVIDVLTLTNVKAAIFCFQAPFSFADGYTHFGRTYCLNL